jgi:protein gp37
MTKIEWTEKTWNPIVGCSIVSPGCTNCYAMRMAARLERMSDKLDHYRGLTKMVNGNPVWTGNLALAPARALLEPLRRKKPTTYFVNSMGDLFHEDVPDAWIDRVFAVMALTPRHTYQVLTKRAARMRNYVVHLYETDYGIERLVEAAVNVSGSPCAAHVEDVTPPLANVWLGVSCERQQEADARIQDLLATPAAVRFVSAEPLLGPVDFTRIGDPRGPHDALGADLVTSYETSLDWIIVGGESGPGARPMHPDWPRSIRDQCVAADVPFFFKQWGEHVPGRVDGDEFLADEDCVGPNPTWGADRGLVVRHDGIDYRRVGKSCAGRLLDGREHNAMPATAATE